MVLARSGTSVTATARPTTREQGITLLEACYDEIGQWARGAAESPAWIRLLARMRQGIDALKADASTPNGGH